jgi:hypothetical protein
MPKTAAEYRLAAEQLLTEAAASSRETTLEGHNPMADRTIAEAQVYATLAISAPEEPLAEMAALRDRVTAIHYEVDGSLDSDGSCVEDGSDWPCPTIRALDPEAPHPAPFRYPANPACTCPEES